MSDNGNRFDLASLIPEPLEFKDKDGTLYDMRSAPMLGPEDYAILERHRRRVTAELGKEDGDMKVLSEAVDEQLRLLIPTLPAERLGAIAFAHKLAVLQWWSAKSAPKGNADPNPEAGESSPA